MSEDKIKARGWKWRDLRAGKSAGWPGAPETNGDPYDPDNMERTDAALIINKGRVLLNLTGLIAARKVRTRKKIAMWFLIFFYIALASLIYRSPSLSPGVILSHIMGGPSSMDAAYSDYGYDYADDKKDSKPTRGAIASQLLDIHYSQSENGLAGTYDIHTALARYESLKALCGREDVATCYGKLETAQISEAFANASKEKSDFRKTSFYDVNQKNDNLEAALAFTLSGLDAALGKPANGVWEESKKTAYCSNDTRKYLQTPHQRDMAKMRDEGLITHWKLEGKIHDSVPVVRDFNELLAHSPSSGNDDCGTPSQVALKVGSGAIEYLVSFAGRVNDHNSTRIGTALYAFIKLDKKDGENNYQAVQVACNNCGGSAFGSNSSVLNGVDSSAKGIIKALKKAGLETNLDKINENNNKGA